MSFMLSNKKKKTIATNSEIKQSNMKHSFALCYFISLGIFIKSFAAANDGPIYDSSAYTECKKNPEEPLYQGGILRNVPLDHQWTALNVNGNTANLSVFYLNNLSGNTFYSFSNWVKIDDEVDSALIRATIVMQNTTEDCIGSVTARKGCWSFLKGGFVAAAPSNVSMLYFKTADDKNVKIKIAGASLQPFTKQQWESNQQNQIHKVRKRTAVIHVSDKKGIKIQGASITVKQVATDFLIGSAISKSIITNLSYQNWFLKRFKATVFENEIKWYGVEPQKGMINYTIPDQMLEFVRANDIIVRARSNIFWEDPRYVPKWVANLTGSEFQSAVNSRISSLVSKYKDDFIHWDVGNVRFLDSYEGRINGTHNNNATLNFYQTARKADPSAFLMMNEFNVVETCNDANSTVDTYISRLRELKQKGIIIDGIGLESHFSAPNLPFVRAVLDKLATLELPIWLTELDISKAFNNETQAVYLEEVLREAFSHPSVKGAMLWTAISPQKGCYQMCLTDTNFKNLPAGDVVDKLQKEWDSGISEGETDEHGSFVFNGFLGEYEVTAKMGNDKVVKSLLWLSQGNEPKQLYIHL